mmetsp:Transcript_2718/g.4267  ORF Transcript_2718/g.4267 Transcript_2718/m.4267 type:complete len:81 (-) Transcript_2718:210-452(-)|eukprot:CAMPEP_0170494822 /NCGR_PEP_ID=MMETSP0208-20121228/14857_1 /TAXON_ID=197538 /ORGANISM="Strombidium inclinatum, Strain S3" /LENGTH=80 /DNA_ID=CAMNT_0010770923 /DNA_START=1522 /DNA_END=1764 /DNA_ORIENTATION=-
MINRIQSSAQGDNQRILPSMAANSDGSFNAEDHLVKFKEENPSDAIFINSVSLGELGGRARSNSTPKKNRESSDDSLNIT